MSALEAQGERGSSLARRYRLPILLCSAAAAEVAASAALCPLEVLKLRMQTSPALAALGLQRALLSIGSTEGMGALFKGFAPIAMRQVPYTACKLVSYEQIEGGLRRALCERATCERATCCTRTRATRPDGHTAGWLRARLRARPHGRCERCTPAAQAPAASAASAASACASEHRLALVLSSGLLAGALSATVSQPFDLLLTRMCGTSAVASLSECVITTSLREQLAYLLRLGPAAFVGLRPRLAMVSLMTAGQFVVYDSLRLALRCPAPANPNPANSNNPNNPTAK